MEYIEINNLRKTYGDELILEDFNCRFKKNQFNALIGPSGRGKTSLLNILIGLDKDYTGEIINLPDDKSIVFQENRLLEDYSIYDNINFVLDKPLEADLINSYLKKLGLHNINSQTKVNQLSGGMKRRVSILRAVLKDSDIYIFDEPFKDMDKASHILVLEFIKKELENKTVIFSTHNQMDIKILEAHIIKI